MMSTDERITELLLKWEERWELGEDVPAAQLCHGCPELVEPLQQRIDRLKRMAWMATDNDEDHPHELPPDPRLNQTLAGRYTLEAVLGEGGFGRVYRAFDTDLHRHVAVKVAHTERLTSPDQLLGEARRAAKLRHPGIVSVHDVGRHEGMVFFVSDLIEGRSLAEQIATNLPTPGQAARLVAEIADALQAAHDQGFVHRDIKPSNILIDGQGRAMVTDFGIATTTDRRTEGEGTFSGTLAYMAPEQVAGETQLLGPRTDIHALGTVLYELLTGTHPFPAMTQTGLRESILFRTPKPVRVVNPAVPAALEEIVMRCLAKHPADRFASTSELAEALRSAPANQARVRLPVWTVTVLLVALGGVALWQGSQWLRTSAANGEHRRAEVETPTGLPVSEEGAFVFDGEVRILTPVKSFAPCTLEAWVRTQGRRDDQFIVGSDVSNFFGIGLAINGGYPTAEIIRGGFNVEQLVPPGEWTHLAAVFGPEKTMLFLNGKKIGTGPATERPEHETRFVIGNLGEDHNKLFFVGEVAAVRISSGERYRVDFMPRRNLRAEADPEGVRSLLLYDGTIGENGAVLDHSGNGNHGRVQRFVFNVSGTKR